MVRSRVGIGLVTVALCFPLCACGSETGREPSSSPIGDPVHGEELFHARSEQTGNGRACSDCHVEADGFQLSPATVEARFGAMEESGVDDPLFRPIDADDFATRAEAATDYTNLREFGLIRIRLPLPENIKLVDPATCTVNDEPAPCESATAYAVSDATFADVWRAVPSILGVVYSGADPDALAWPRGPNPRGGYLSDARADTLAQQASGAFLDHAQVTTAPSAADLDDIAAYERQLVADPEPELDELQAEGKKVFKRACGQCHNGKGMSTPISDQGQKLVHFIDLHLSCPRPVDTTTPARWSFAECAPGLAKNQQTYEISFSDGFKLLRTTTDPGRALLSGFVNSVPADDGSCEHTPCGAEFTDDWEKFDITALHGISKTAPYFHDNSAATLEDVVIHYEEFFKREAAVLAPAEAPPFLSTDNVNRDRPNVPEERAALVAYLEVL